MKLDKETFRYYQDLVTTKMRIDGCHLNALFRKRNWGRAGKLCPTCGYFQTRACDLGAHPTPKERKLIDMLQKSEII